MVLHLNMEVKELAPRAIIFNPLFSQMLRYHFYQTIRKMSQCIDIKGGMELIHFKPLFQSGQHVDSKGRDLWPSTVHLKIQVRYIAYINT